MRPRNPFSHLVLVAAAAALGMAQAPQQGMAVGGSGGGITVVEGSPYSAEMTAELTQKGPDGEITKKTTARIYRDSKGRERREEDPTVTRNSSQKGKEKGADPTGQTSGEVRAVITDPVARITYLLNVTQKWAYTVPMPPAPAPKKPAASPAPTIQITPAAGPAGDGAQIPQITVEQGAHVEVSPPGTPAGPIRPTEGFPGQRVVHLEPKTIEGLRAEGTRTIVSVPSGKDQTVEIVNETWYSPELKIELMRSYNDPRSGSMITRATRIKRGEQSISLFQLPPDYRKQDLPSIIPNLPPSAPPTNFPPK